MKDLRNIIDDNNQAAAKAVVHSVQKPRKDYTASNNLKTLVSNNQLTEDQEVALTYFNVYHAGDAMELFKNVLNSKDPEDFSDTDIISILYHLLNFNSSDYVICDGYDGTVELLDKDTLQDILDY